MPQRMTYWLTSLCASAVLVSAGCATVGAPWTRAETSPSAVAAPSEESISLSYRTDSDRLNLSGGLLSGRIQAAAYQPGGITPIPPVTTSKLRVYYPHPQGIPATALAVVSFEAQTAGETNGALAMWKKLTGGQNDAAGPIAPQEVWSMDFPKAELDAILAKLRRQNFFERSQVLGASTLLATDINGVKFGKEYLAVDELDALILRVRLQGQLIQGARTSSF